MIIDKIINSIVERFEKTKEKKEDIAAGLAAGLALGLVAGLAFGLVAGLAFGLAAGLALGLAVGLAVGLIAGLAFGLAVGLVVGLAAGLAAGLADFIIELSKTNPTLSFFIALGIAIFILAEILFWMDKKQPKIKQSKFFFTIERKILGFLESLYIIGNVIGTYQIVVKGVPMLNEWLGQYGQSILSFVGWGTLGIIIIYAYIKINSMKYKR